MATLCNKCLQPIQWKQDSADRWVAMELKGDKEHRLVCRREPIVGTKQTLKIQIGELEEKLKKTEAALQQALAGQRYAQTELRLLQEKYAIYQIVQNILNAGVAWFRAREARNGKTDEKLEALKEAVIRYCEVEGKGKKSA